MFLAGESGRYRWKMYKQREKQPADKRRSQAAAAVLLSTQEQSAAPAMERWVLGGLGERGRFDNGSQLPSKKERESERGGDSALWRTVLLDVTLLEGNSGNHCSPFIFNPWQRFSV